MPRSVSSLGAESGRTTDAGCRSKVTTAERSPCSCATRPNPLYHQAVAGVNPVIGADRDRTRPFRRAHARVVEDLHSESRLRACGEARVPRRATIDHGAEG